jgi:purine-binding chemotaxis protein CheW
MTTLLDPPRTDAGDGLDTQERTASPGDAKALPGRYLTFALRSDIYALALREVTEIIALGNITNVPMMPSFVQGVINLRGRVVPVVDLVARFGRGSTDITRRTQPRPGRARLGRWSRRSRDRTPGRQRHRSRPTREGDIEPPPNLGTGVPPAHRARASVAPARAVPRARAGLIARCYVWQRASPRTP